MNEGMIQETRERELMAKISDLESSLFYLSQENASLKTMYDLAVQGRDLWEKTFRDFSKMVEEERE
jgi:hypothetical protein